MGAAAPVEKSASYGALVMNIHVAEFVVMTYIVWFVLVAHRNNRHLTDSPSDVVYLE